MWLRDALLIVQVLTTVRLERVQYEAVLGQDRANGFTVICWRDVARECGPYITFS